FFTSSRRQTRSLLYWSSDVCSADLSDPAAANIEWPPILCSACGKPLATEKMIAGMLNKLAGHSMFAAPGSLDRLKMCADCRVIDIMKHERSVDVRDV